MAPKILSTAWVDGKYSDFGGILRHILNTITQTENDPSRRHI